MSPADRRTFEAGRRLGILTIRLGAWGLLIGLTLFLVRAEARRPDVPDGIAILDDLVYRASKGRRVRLDLYRPEGPTPPGGRPAVLAIHGGGWRGGSKRSLSGMAATLAQHGFLVAAVDYRLSRPGAPSWPENFEDVREAVRWLRRHAPDLGVDPRRIAALGMSAGGHLAALLGTYPESSTLPGSARVQAVVALYPPVDLRRLHDGNPLTAIPTSLLLGGNPATVPARFEEASPIRHVSPGDAPMLLIHGGQDRLVPPDQSEAMAVALRSVGVESRLIVIDEARHGFEFQAGRHDLLPEVLRFLETAPPQSDSTPR